MAVVIVTGATLGGCSSSEQLLGSDGSSVSSGGAGSGGETRLGALVDTLKQGTGTCVQVSFALDATGTPDCSLALARRTSDCSCSAPGFSGSALNAGGNALLQSNGVCGLPGQPPCSEWCWCTVARAADDVLTECRESAQPTTSTAGWCFVSPGQGEAEAALTSDCSANSQGKFRMVGAAQLQTDDLMALSCSGVLTHIPPQTPAALGAPCVADDEWSTAFSGYDPKEVNVEDRANQCETGICLVNHFQGRASCPYGQASSAGDCLLPDGSAAVTSAVKPQLEARQASVASICSCRCAGDGPGPYCTCPDSMQCEHLVDDLNLGGGDLAGSYCIPKDSQYDPAQLSSVCVEPNCGPAHP